MTMSKVKQNAGFQFKLEIDSYPLVEALRKEEFKVQEKKLRAIIRNAERKIIVPAMKAHAPVGETGNLKRSIGIIAGKRKFGTFMFAGPRMATAGDRSKHLHSGWVANILQNWKGKNKGRAGTNFGWVIERTIPKADQEIFLSIQNVLGRK